MLKKKKKRILCSAGMWPHTSVFFSSSFLNELEYPVRSEWSAHKVTQEELLQSCQLFWLYQIIQSKVGGVYRSAQEAKTEFHWLGGLNSRNAFSHSSGGWKSQAKVQHSWILVRIFFLACRWLACHCVSSYKGTCPIMRAPPSLTLCKPKSPPEVPHITSNIIMLKIRTSTFELWGTWTFSPSKGLCSTGTSTEHSVMAYTGKEPKKVMHRHMCLCICITDSLCCMPETWYL